MKAFLLHFRRPLLIAGVFSLAINLALLAPAIFLLQVFDRVLVSRSVETLVMLGLIVGLALLVMGVLDYLRARALAVIGILLDRMLASRVLEQLISEVARAGTRAYVYGMRDLASMRAFLSGSGVVALFDAPWILVYLAVIFAFSPVLGMISAAAAVLLVALAVANERLTRSGLEAVQAGAREASRFVEGGIRNAEAVTALGMQAAVAERWHRLNDRPSAAQLTVGRLGGAVTSATRLTRQAIQTVVLAVGAWLVIEQVATPGVMIAATIILGRALAPVETLIAGWKSIVEARGAYRRLEAILAAAQGREPLTELPKPEGRLEAESLVYAPSPEAKPILRGVSFAASPGELLAVIGPSGSGKTTLARLLVGARRPTGGAVRLDGADLAQWDPQRLGCWIGYLPQDVELFAGTVGENIARMGEVDSDRVIAAAKSAGAHETILRLPRGYDTEIGEGGVLLSGGQRQRVGFARALYGEPSLIVLDEPDASLDADGEQALLAAVREQRDRGATVIVVTQRRGMLGVADRVIVLQEGRIERAANRPQAEAAGELTGGRVSAP